MKWYYLSLVLLTVIFSCGLIFVILLFHYSYNFFSAPEPKAQVHYCDHALSVVRRPSSVRPSVINFSHFRLLLWNHRTEFNETWQEARTQYPLPSLCFSGRSEKQDGRPGLWLAQTFSTSPLKPLNGIQQNLTWSKISTSSTKFVFFGPIGKTRWPPWPLIGWDIFDYSSETAEWNSTKLDMKQDLNVLYQVCVFRADRKNKMAALASDWLRHFRLLLWNRWTEFNKTWHEARSQRPLPSLCFSGRSEKEDGHPGLWLAETFSTSPLKTAERNSTKLWHEARSQRLLPSLCFSGRSEKQDGRPGLWLAETFSTTPLKPLNGIQRNLTGSKISTSSTKFVFFGPIGKTRWPPWPLIGWDIFVFCFETAEQNSTKLDMKQDLNVLYQVCVFSGRSEKQNGRPGLWLAETFSTTPLKPLNGIQRNLTWSKISTSSTKFVFFGPIGKTRWPPWPLIGSDIFDFSSETVERNSTKLDMKQDLNVLYQVCVFRADRKNKMATLASDWPRHFRLLLWNRWTEFKETWQEARSQRLLPSLCFSGRSEKQDGRPGLWLAETFSTSPLKPLNGIQRNLAGSKISTSSTKFVFFGPIGKTRWPPWPLIGSDIFDFSSETVERNSTKLDMKQDLNVLYQVCVFRADRKNKMATLASDWPRHFRLLLWNRWTEFKETWHEARSQRLLPSLCFSGRSEKQDGRPGLWLAEIFSTSPLKPLNGIQRNLAGSKISTSSTKFVFFGPIGKTRWPPWPLIGWDIFVFCFETAEQNSTKLDRKQDLNVLYQVCVFRADQKNKMAALASDWLRHFRLSPLNLLNGIQGNLTRCKISTSSTKFVFFGPIGKTRWPPLPLIGWDIFHFSSETAEQNLMKFDRKQDLNVLYQVYVFRTDLKNKMAALASDWLRHFRLFWNRWTEFNETWQDARSQRPLPTVCFSGRMVNKNVHLGRFLKKVAHCTQVHDMWPFGPLVFHFYYQFI